jgi:cytochrome c oxidase subunit II
MMRGMTIYLYELAWILPSVAIPAAMLVALIVTAFGAGIHVPGVEGRVDPTKLAETAPFNEPGVVEVGPSRYEVRMIAGIWFFSPNEVRVPAGSTVTFIATSRDVIHGLALHDANINLMLLPGRVARATVQFNTPGEHLFVCHEYCGIAHHTMFGRVIVEPRPQ